MGKKGRIVAVCVSDRAGVSKTPVAAGRLIAGYGLEGDAHAGTPNRQVSLLSEKSIEKMRARLREEEAGERGEPAGEKLRGAVSLSPGAFAENLTLDAACAFEDLPVGTRLRLQRGPLLEITQIGKECHTGCAIRQAVGDCVMPREGVFARVIEGGEVRPGDEFEIMKDEE